MVADTAIQVSLTDDFVQSVVKTVKPHWGELGWVTYKRTYARWVEAKGRTENWDETVKRVVEGNINLDPRLKKAELDPDVYAELTDEAQQLFKLVYGLAATPSGRNLWISGSDYQKRNGDALNNCWFVAVRPQAYGQSHIVPWYLDKQTVAPSMPFSFMFDQLMKGGGVGFSVAPENIRQMPVVNYQINLAVIIDKDSKAYAESIAAGAVDRDAFLATNNLADTLHYTLPDTREGWVEANAALIDAHFKGTNATGTTQLVLDISQIRERGAKIHGFGGTASGPAPLVEMLGDINAVLNAAQHRQLTSVDATDIGNLIGKTVVAGNVRRSAEIALGGADDSAFITMKQDKDKLYHHRWASNNSVLVTSSFTGYDEVAAAIAQNGEPGMVNLELARNYGRIADGLQEGIDAEVEGTNPCGEISLANGEPCNLFEVFPVIAEEQGWDLHAAFRLAARYTKRVTFSDYDWEVSRNVIERNRRIGVSMSGIQDWILTRFGHRVVTGFKDGVDAQTGVAIKEPIYDPAAIAAFDNLYQGVVAADKEYSGALNCNESVKHTTVKPSGTVSKLAGVSEGMHFHYSNYLIQRIRFQDSDPVLDALAACGYKIEPDIYSKNTMCVEFPVRAANADNPDFASAGNVSIAEQFATQAFLQTYWADNSVSCTVTFQPDTETDQIAPLFNQYRNVIKSTSLLPYSGAGYKQAPKEPFGKDDYQQMRAQIHGNVALKFDELHPADVKDLELVDQTDCASGACPVK